MTAQERATQAAFKTAEKFGPEEETWPLFARREIAKLRRDAHFEDFMAEIATAPTLEAIPELHSAANVTQQSIDEWYHSVAREHGLSAEKELSDRARINGLLGNKRQVMVARVQRLNAFNEWVDDPDEYIATTDMWVDVMSADPRARTHVTVEWREFPDAL